MRYLIFSDLHGYSEFLPLLEKQVQNLGYDQVWFLGDAIGRGPDPIGCLGWLRDREAKCIQGNWEYWLLEENPPLVDSASQVQLDDIKRVLEKEDGWKEYVKAWPESYTPLPQLTLIHGGPLVEGAPEPHSTLRYLDMPIKAGESLKKIIPEHILCGHTHEAGYFYHSKRRGQTGPFESLLHDGNERRAFELCNGNHRYVINVGTLIPDLDRTNSKHTGSFCILDASNERLTLEFFTLDVDR